MKTLAATTAILLLLSAPAMAMRCCGDGKGRPGICARNATPMGHGAVKSKAGCCCEGMSGTMTRRG